MEKINFSAKELISYGFELFKPNWMLLVGVFLINMVLTGIINSGSKDNFILGIIANLVSIFLSIGIMTIYLKLVRGKKAVFEDLYIHYKKFPGVFVLTMILTIMFVLGTLALIIPGIYLMLKYLFALTYKVDTDAPIKESLDKSAKMTEGIKLKLLGLGILFILFNLLGLLCLVVGLLVTVPVTGIAFTKLYERLK